jgi:CRISPR system Cascade subunit CasE
VTIGTTVFEGLLRVTDADTFKFALINGIGRAKAYGCGFITIESAL